VDVHAEIEMGALGRDFVETLRSLRRQPGFAVVVILTAALGIATTTAVYSLVYSILIRPYPYHEPERLVRVESVYVKQGGVRKGCSLLDIEDYRRRATKLVDIGAYTNFDAQLLSDAGHAPGVPPVEP
jgi:putative ABC transport system permease protein